MGVKMFLIVISVIFIGGCAKAPVENVNVAKAALEAAETAEIDKQQPEQSAFENAPGWDWYVPPQKGILLIMGQEHGLVFLAGPGDGMVITYEWDKDRSLVAHIAYGGSIRKEFKSYRPVVFDGERKRYLLQDGGSASSKEVAIARFVLDHNVVPADKLVYLGIEVRQK